MFQGSLDFCAKGLVQICIPFPSCMSDKGKTLQMV
jgi:hypothetical protein